MKEIENIDLFEGIENKYIASAEKAGKARKKLKVAIPAAAGLCAVLLSALFIGKAVIKNRESNKEANAGTTQLPAVTEIVTEAPRTDEPSPVPTEASSDDADRLYLSYVGGIHEAVVGGSEDSIPWGIDRYMFIYNGKEYFLLSRLDPLTDVIGEKLGTVELFDFKYSAHWIDDEDSSSDEVHPPYIILSENELKGTLEGNIFSVNGADPDDLICMRDDFFGYVMLFTAENGITSRNGAAFFEDVLHISDDLTALRYYSHTDVTSRDGANQYKLDPSLDEIGLLIRAMDEAEWVNDTRTFGSSFFNDEEASHLSESKDTVGYYLTLCRKDRLDLDVIVYRDGIITIGSSSFSSKALSADTALLQPLFELMDGNQGQSLAKNTEKDRLAECMADPRFGEMAPRLIPKGLHITNTYIEYVIDPETGALTGTDHIRIDYKDRGHDSIIYLWIRPIERMDTEYDIKCALKKGVKAVALDDFDESCMYIQHSRSEEDPNRVYSQTVVTYKDAVIYVEAFGTYPEVIVELLRSIMD